MDESFQSSDDSIRERVSSGIIREILIEAKRVGATAAYLTSWEGHLDLDCDWVLESGMSKVAREWWDLGRELRYPGYLDEDFPLYDKKTNRLSIPPSTRTFLSEIPCLESKDPGHLPKLLSLMRLVTLNDFDSWNFLNAYHSGTLDERFFQPTTLLYLHSARVPKRPQCWSNHANIHGTPFSHQLSFRVCLGPGTLVDRGKYKPLPASLLVALHLPRTYWRR